MTWWGPGFDPEFDVDSVKDDLNIVNLGISNTNDSIVVFSEIEDNHKIIWDYWNDMCKYIDQYLELESGLSLKYGPLEDSNVVTMAEGSHDDVIYQMDTTDVNEGYYFALEPNPKYLFGKARVGAPNIPDPIPAGYDVMPQTIVLSPIEVEFITTELSNRLDEDGSGGYQDNTLARRTAQEGERDQANAKVSILDNLISDCNSGLSLYPDLSGMITLAEQVRTECATAAANAQAEIDNGSPAFDGTSARYAYLSTRLSEIGNRKIDIDNEAEYIRSTRFFWTSMRCNITNGSKSWLEGSSRNLVRLNNEKIRLERIITEYETL